MQCLQNASENGEQKALTLGLPLLIMLCAGYSVKLILAASVASDQQHQQSQLLYRRSVLSLGFPYPATCGIQGEDKIIITTNILTKITSFTGNCTPHK